VLKRRANSNSDRENLRGRILLPLGVGLGVLVATCVFSLVQVKEGQIHDAIEDHLVGVADLFKLEVAEEAELMGQLIDVIAADAKVQEAWLARDRGWLAEASQSHLVKFQRDYRVTNFSFVEPSQCCFLCVHEMECPGDTVAHFVVNRAAQSLSPAFGLEIGESGTLTVHVVKPWYLGGQLVGFIELGQDTGPITRELNQALGVQLLITVQKEFMDSTTWTNGRVTTGPANAWNRFRRFVIVESTLARLPDNLENYMVANHREHQHVTFEMEQGGRPYIARPLALIDAGGTDIGDILVIKDVSAERAALWTLSFITVVSGIVVGALLFGLFYIILGRIEDKLARTRDDWNSEIAERKRVMEELARRNDFMKNVFESLTHPFYVIDAKTHRILMGNSTTGLVGQPTGITCHQLTHHSPTPCHDPKNVCPLVEARRTKEPVTVEHVHYDDAGKERLVEVHGYPILDNSGEVVQLIEYTLDITERKQIEKELRDSRTHSRMIIETASDAYIAINAQGIVTDWNRKAEKMFGWLSKEAVGKPLTELIIDSGLGKIHNEALSRCVRTGHGPILNKRVEVTALHRSGRPFPVELTVWTTGRSPNLQFNAFIAEITERKVAEEEIRKFKTIADHASYGVAIAGLDTKYIYTNASYARMHGREPEWFVGKRVLTTLTKSSRKKGARTIRKLVQEQKVQPEEFWYLHKDGHEFPGLISPVMIPDAKGKPAFVAAVLVDISEQKRAEEQLRESEKQFRNLFEHSNDAIFVHTVEGHIIEANQRSSEMLGYDRQKLVTLPIRALHPDSESEVVEKAFATVVEEGSAQFQSRFRRVDGSTIDVEISSRILDEEQGIIQGVVRDISERVRQVSELRKLSAAVSQSANLICISNAQGTIEYVNPEFCRTTGYSSDEAVGQRWNLLEPERSEENLYDDIWAQVSDGHTWSGNLRNRHKNNELFWARMTITPIFNDNGQIVNHLAVIEDITNEIVAQQGLAEADKLSAIGTLAAGVAHEFKNYLAGILGNASYALSGLDDNDGIDLARESLGQIVELGERANGVAMSLLTYSKAKPDEIAFEDIRAIIENSIRMVEKEIRNQSIEILTHFENLPPLRVSASKIQQVLLNLIINARHAIDSDGVITVGLVRQDDKAVIKVSDTGKGIPATNCSRIFDPFYSTKGVWGKDAVTGTGMGLSICRNIAREHNGDLTVESAVGVGSTFIFSLPLHSAEDRSAASSAHDSEQAKLLLFSADQSLIADYRSQADSAGFVLQVVDDVDLIGDDLNNVAAAVICDAGIVARGKLFRMHEVCHKFDVPFVTVNCGDADCRESALGNNASSVHEGRPTLDVISESLRSISTHKLSI